MGIPRCGSRIQFTRIIQAACFYGGDRVFFQGKGSEGSPEMSCPLCVRRHTCTFFVKTGNCSEGWRNNFSNINILGYPENRIAF